jgi:hypothetical protein
MATLHHFKKRLDWVRRCLSRAGKSGRAASLLRDLSVYAFIAGVRNAILTNLTVLALVAQ